MNYAIPMTDEISNSALPHFFEKNPELKKHAEALLAKLSPEEKKRNHEILLKFVAGEISWAEAQNVPAPLLKHIATIAYDCFRANDYRQAEILFKGLAVLDHFNWYYRAALGAIYQKKNLLEDAVAEYSAALILKPDEITALVNRGQCLLKLNQRDEAIADFVAAVNLPLDAENPWHKRAELLCKILTNNDGEDKKDS